MAKRKGESFVLDFSGDVLKAQTFEEVVKERDDLAAALREARENDKVARLEAGISVLDDVLKGLRSENDSTQLRAIIASVEWMRADIAAAMKPPGSVLGAEAPAGGEGGA